jgi:tetratricopeptide (TPR) repeat protein
MFSKTFWMALCLAGLAACSALPGAPATAQLPWHDETFGWDAAAASMSSDELFRLDPKLQNDLQDPALQHLSAAKRLDHLLALLYGRELRAFPYAPGHSTPATETWQQKRGDCLSLTVLAYAMARALNMKAQMQEVSVPALFERRGSVDILSQHVNVLLPRSGPLRETGSLLVAQDMVIDFERQIGSNRVGQALTDQDILARYQNNMGAEQLALGRPALAYAWFKAAILAQPGYAASYANLALLYRRAGLGADAETLLRQAVALNDEDTVALMSLQQMLQEQGRTAEAQAYTRVLQSRRDRDPYHWIALGLKRLQDAQYRESIRALEQAQRMTHGFAEVHRYLALAYWRAGESERAREQLNLLSSLDTDSTDVDTLRKKFNGAPAGR